MPIAPGFMDLEYLFSQRLSAAGWQIINDAVVQSARFHDQALNTLLSVFAEAIDPTKPMFRFRLPVSVEMQPLEGEDDSPIPVRGFDNYQLAFPLLDVGIAWGTNRKSRAKMTVEDANNNTLNALQADSRWHRRQILNALFVNTAYPFADVQFGPLTIKTLANGDTDQYHRKDGTIATDNHFLAQAAAIDAVNYPFTGIYDELTEHPDNQGEVVVYVAKNLANPIKGLADFIPYVENKRIQPGISADTLTDFPAVPFGDRRLGYLENGDCYVVRWDVLPAGYMVAMTTENTKKVLGYRDEPEDELRGLRPEYNTYDGNHMVTRLLRTRGFAVQNRVGAVVMQIGNATYQIPAGYNLLTL